MEFKKQVAKNRLLRFGILACSIHAVAPYRENGNLAWSCILMFSGWTIQVKMLGSVINCLHHFYVEIHYSSNALAALEVQQIDQLCILHSK